MVDCQPYVHAGMYSEGEFAVSPTIVQLAAERKLPVGGDWDTATLGQDEGKDRTVHHPEINSDRFKNVFVNRLVFKYDIEIILWLIIFNNDL